MQRRWLVVWLAVILILVGVTSRSGALITLSLPLLLYLGAGLFLSPNRIDLDIQRYQNADIVTSGTPVQIKLTCTNLGQPLHEIYIEDQPPPGVKQQSGRCNFRAALDTGEQIDIDYTITGERGIHKFQPLEAVAGDPFWLFPERSSVHVYSQLMAVPVIKSLKRIPIQPQQTRPYPGPIRSRKGGSGTDFFGIREYQTGDPMRWVNWQAAARNSEELYTNLFERENIADAGIIVDARQQTDVQEANGGEPLFEHSIRMAAALADAFLNDGNRVSLLVYGFGMDRVFPGYGKAQRERILRCLAEARTGRNYPLESLNYLPTRLFPARSQLVIVSPLSRHDAPQLIRLQAAGYDVLIVSPDPVAFQAQAMASERNIKEAVRIANVERSFLLRKLNRAGIQVIDWKVDQLPDLALQRAINGHLRVAQPVRRQR
jgi:uncharacterized protein (DUF58 family)